jgi:hypothetical protein
MAYSHGEKVASPVKSVVYAGTEKVVDATI